MITFDVVGIPRPQGSKKAFSANGRAMLKEAGGLDHARWRNAVADAAKAIADTLPQPLSGPLRLDVQYRFTMPASRPKATRTAGQAWKTTAPDRDKLDRAICDAYQASGRITNDSQICAGESVKYEVTGWTGATITVTKLDTPTEPSFALEGCDVGNFPTLPAA